MSSSSKDYFVELLSKFDLKPQSIKLYSIKLNNINKQLPESISSQQAIKKNYKAIIKYIKSLYNINDKLAYLNALIKITENSDALFSFKELRDLLNKMKFKSYKSNKKKDDFVSYDVILDVCKPSTDINEFMLYFSVRYPVRLALWNIKIAKTLKSMNDHDNYIYVRKNGSKLYMNDFKNSNSMGRVIINIDKEDNEILLAYLKRLDKPIYLLYNNDQCHPFVSVNAYSRKFKSLLNGALNRLDNPLTMNDVRRSYESFVIQSDAYKALTNTQKDEVHRRLLHNSVTAHSIYNKV